MAVRFKSALHAISQTLIDMSLKLWRIACVKMAKPILVIGAGVAGLSLARTLLAHSVPVRIFDKLPQLRKHSYGITLLPWAYEPLIRALQLGTAAELKRATATDAAVGGLGNINPLGAYARSASDSVSSDAQSYRCGQSKLSEYLAKGVEVEYSSKLESISCTDTGVLVQFEDNKTAEGSLVVGADGVHSAGQITFACVKCECSQLTKRAHTSEVTCALLMSACYAVRKSTLPDVDPTIIPALAVNGSLTLARSDFLAGIGKYMGDSQVMVGSSNRTAVTISVSEHTERAVRISWTFTWQPADALDFKSERESIHDAKTIPQSFYNRLQELGPLTEPFQSVLDLDTARRTARYSWLMRSMQVSEADLQQTAEQGIALIGDAAHAMPIVAGQGANHAMLDGVQLGLALAHNQTSQAVHDFVQAQYGRWQSGISLSNQHFSELHEHSGQKQSLSKI